MDIGGVEPGTLRRPLTGIGKEKNTMGKGVMRKSKYIKVKLKDGSTIDEHRLVWINHHGEIPAGYWVHHKNDNKHDNSIDNLELKTPAEHNKHHGMGHGPSRRTEIVHGTTSGYRRGCRCLCG